MESPNPYNVGHSRKPVGDRSTAAEDFDSVDAVVVLRAQVQPESAHLVGLWGEREGDTCTMTGREYAGGLHM